MCYKCVRFGINLFMWIEMNAKIRLRVIRVGLSLYCVNNVEFTHNNTQLAASSSVYLFCFIWISSSSVCHILFFHSFIGLAMDTYVWILFTWLPINVVYKISFQKTMSTDLWFSDEHWTQIQFRKNRER